MWLVGTDAWVGWLIRRDFSRMGHGAADSPYMHGGPPAPWHERSIDEARRVHDRYVSTVAERVARFGTLMEEAGFRLEELDWSSLDAFDDLWYWAQDHLSIFSERVARLQRGEITPWTPYIPGCVLSPDWPSFNGQPELTVEAQEFASGVAALLAEHAVEHWGARWVFGHDLPLDESLQLRSILEIPRDPANPAASFGPVHVSPEQLIAGGLRRHHPDPLWLGLPEWHRLHERIRGPYKDWTQLFRDEAEEFHDLYIGGHIRRLSEFREWLRVRGLDTRAMVLDSVDDIDLIWAWAKANIEFAEQVRRPRAEWRTWYPTLAQGAEPNFELPRWDTVQLSADTLAFASGLAACVTEVALRTWGADWHLDGRRGDLRGVNRTHLYVKGTQGRLETWLNIEHEIAEWLAEAVVRARRTPPRPAMWRRVIGETEMIAQFTALYEVPPAPWLAWRARFEPRLLPEVQGTHTFSEAIAEPAPVEPVGVRPLIPILADEHQPDPAPVAPVGGQPLTPTLAYEHQPDPAPVAPFGVRPLIPILADEHQPDPAPVAPVGGQPLTPTLAYEHQPDPVDEPEADTKADVQPDAEPEAIAAPAAPDVDGEPAPAAVPPITQTDEPPPDPIAVPPADQPAPAAVPPITQTHEPAPDPIAVPPADQPAPAAVPPITQTHEPPPDPIAVPPADQPAPAAVPPITQTHEPPPDPIAVPPMIWRTELASEEQWPEPSLALGVEPPVPVPPMPTPVAMGRTFSAPPSAAEADPLPVAPPPPPDPPADIALDPEPESTIETPSTAAEADPLPVAPPPETPEPAAPGVASNGAAGRMEIAARLAAAISLERAALAPEPMTPINAIEPDSDRAAESTEGPETREVAEPVPVPPAEISAEVTPAEAVASTEDDPLGYDGDGMELLIEPDDAAGDRDWTIDVVGGMTPVDAELVDRFARRLNRAKGVMSAQLGHSNHVQLRMNRFGHGDLDSVEALVHRVWDQTKATHRGPVLAGSPGN